MFTVIGNNVNMSNPAQTPQDTFWWRLTHLEPAMYKAAIVAFFVLLTAVGVHFATSIPDALTGLVAVLVPLVQALWTRGSVVPNDKVVVSAPDPIGSPTIVAPGPALTTAPDAAILYAARHDAA